MSEHQSKGGGQPPLRTTVEGEVFLHRELWVVVQRQLASAESNPKGAFYDDLVAMVFTSHTLEGYLNFVGERLDPNFWEKERHHFRQTGFAGKAKKIFELCGRPEPDKTIRPYSSVWELKILRDQIAHGNPIRFRLDTEHGHDDRPDYTGYSPLTDAVTHEKAHRYAADADQIIGMIHDAAKSKINDLWFGDEGLRGPMSHRGHFTGPSGE